MADSNEESIEVFYFYAYQTTIKNGVSVIGSAMWKDVSHQSPAETYNAIICFLENKLGRDDLYLTAFNNVK